MNRVKPHRTFGLFGLALAILLLFGCRSPEEPGFTSASSGQMKHQDVGPYIPVEEYFVLHPEEAEISSSFSRIVQGPPQPLSSDRQKNEISIAFVYPGHQASDYWQRSVRSFVARMDELHINYRLAEFFSKGGGVEIRKQEQQLKDALEKDPDYLVFTLDVKQHQRLIERILAKGRPRLILQNITTPLRVWEGNQPFYVGFDHIQGTRMLADYFLKTNGGEGKFGLLYYSQGYVSSMRGDSFLRFIREGNGPELAAAYYTDGEREKSRRAARQLAEVDGLRFIYACSTDVALGGVEGLQDAGRQGEIMINGWGGGALELAALERGQLEVTVMRMNDDNGVAMAEAIRLQVLDREQEIPTVFSGDFALISRATSKNEITRLQQQAFRYSGMPESR